VGSNDSQNNRKPYVIGGSWNMSKTLTMPAVISGKYRAGTQTEYDSYPISAWSATSAPAVIANATVNTLLARSNPSKPHVSLPNFFAELGDIPRLIKDRGGSLLKKQAKGNLNLEFGWNLLFSDLIKLNTFGKAVDRRIDHLSHMYKRGGSHALGGGAGNISNVRDNPVSLTPYTVVRNHVGHSHTWISYSWIPVGDLRDSYPTYDGYRAKVLRDMLGLYPNVGILWDAIPWSWLIDWFSDIGDSLWASANNLGFIPGRCYQMTESSAETIETIVPKAGFTGGITPASYKRLSKSRVVLVPGIATANVPILSNKQIGILASLAVLRV
jgi:hypothetical protein